VNDDRDLRDAFAELRESDLRSTPRYQCGGRLARRSGERGGRGARRHKGLAIAATLLLVVTISVAYLIRRPQTPEQVVTSKAISTWRAPTDFLLRTPGSDLTSSVPAILPQLPNLIKGDRS
jgi:hypothetical protein